MSETIGFIGLGHLGLSLATNLLNAGYALRVYNRTASKADPLVARGAQLVTRPVGAVTTGGVVASIVWDDAALESVVMSEGFLEHLGPGGIHMLTQTLFPAPIYQSYGKRIAEKSAPFSQTAIPLKDVGLFKKTAQQVESPTPIASLVQDLLRNDGGKA